MIDNDLCWLKEECNGCDCDKFCVRLFKLDYLYSQALIELPQRKYISLKSESDGTDRDNFKTLSELSQNIEEFVESGGNLYLHSPICGNGKTAWSLRLVQSYFNKIWYKTELTCRALFISVPRLLIALKDNISEKNDYVQHIKEHVLTADLVIWDDIATKQTSVFETENLFSMIESRMLSGKANIFTSNLCYEELQNAIGDRLASRINNLSINLEFKGKDKRGLK